MALTTGTKAPDFTLKCKTPDDLVDVRLSVNFGNKPTVLLFFPLAFTSVCTDEMCSVSQGIQEYAELGATVFGISVDSPFAQEAWANKSNISIPLLSDFNKEAAKAYDVLYEDFLPGKLGFHGVAKRSAFVVDKEGTIVYAESSDDPKDLPDFEAIKAVLKA